MKMAKLVLGPPAQKEVIGVLISDLSAVRCALTLVHRASFNLQPWDFESGLLAP